MKSDPYIVKALKDTQHLKWHSRHDSMPPNDYDYRILIQFNDGHITFSDGGSVHDNEAISLWKDLV